MSDDTHEPAGGRGEPLLPVEKQLVAGSLLLGALLLGVLLWLTRTYFPAG